MKPIPPETDTLAWFEQRFPTLVEAMRHCRFDSPHHLEGDVWTHSRRCYENALRYGADPAIRWACLLHDLGRLQTREVRDGKTRFGDYEPVSMAMALDVLAATSLTPGERLRILKIIALQYEGMTHIKFEKPPFDQLLARFRHEEDLLRDLAVYARCDMNAREVEASRQRYYRDENILAFQSRIADLRPTSPAPRDRDATLTLLVGVPCAGKSTYLEQQLAQRGDGRHLLVSRDRCTLKIGALHGLETYDDSYRLMQSDPGIKKQVDLLDEAIEDIAEHYRHDITIDNPNLSASGRAWWIQRKRETHRIRVVVFLKSFEQLLACDRPGKRVSRASVIHRLKKFQLPLRGDGMDELEFRLSPDMETVQ